MSNVNDNQERDELGFGKAVEDAVGLGKDINVSMEDGFTIITGDVPDIIYTGTEPFVDDLFRDGLNKKLLSMSKVKKHDR